MTEKQKRFVVDSWAWVEYFGGTESGEKVKGYVENENNVILTSVVTIAELISKFIRSGMNTDDVLRGITTLSSVLSLDLDASISAGEAHAKIRSHIKDFGLADAFVLAMAKKDGAKIITGDPHFEHFPEAILIRK